jgi:predicted Zn finger-like uncharacterized protein
MQLICPSCGSRYRIDASSWPAETGADGAVVLRPRKVRCKVCRDVWHAVPEEEALELDDPLPPEEGPRPAAWASIGGWPEPRAVEPSLHVPPPVFMSPTVLTPQPPPPFVAAPPPEPRAGLRVPPSLLQPPADPPFTFQRPPGTGPRPANGLRLPGPGAFDDGEDDELGAARSGHAPDEADDRPLPPTEPWHEDEEEEEPRRRWPWVAGAALLTLAVIGALVVTGQVKPEAYGLPPYDPAALSLPEWARPAGVQLPALAVPRTPPPPLAISADATKRRLAGDRRVWEIRGRISNPTKRRLAVPPVELLLLDGAGEVVGRWTVRPDRDALKPGETTAFETSAIDPPDSAERLRVQLKPAGFGQV